MSVSLALKSDAGRVAPISDSVLYLCLVIAFSGSVLYLRLVVAFFADFVNAPPNQMT